jgi:hypothetical protein
MKFTIDTSKKIILFTESFTKEDIDYLFSILNIDGIEKWKITKEIPLKLDAKTPEASSFTYDSSLYSYVITNHL